MKMSHILFGISTKVENPAKVDETVFQRAKDNLLVLLTTKARHGSTHMVVNSYQVEGKGFNLRGFLGAEGFTLVNLQQKRILILWNC